LSSATSVDEALWLEARGVDAVRAQGVEAGGHRGMFLSEDLSTQLGTFALVPQLVQAIKIPVIAAGGIADAKGVAAAMALGAAGVQVGTSYMLRPEATTSTVHRAALKSDVARLAVLVTFFAFYQTLMQTVITDDAVRKGLDIDEYDMIWQQVGYGVGILYGVFTGLWLSARITLPPASCGSYSSSGWKAKSAAL
jgi:NAD(P)H-dependent flavin oxidoreductase YrpB (nitropropane dioxygenase family)